MGHFSKGRPETAFETAVKEVPTNAPTAAKERCNEIDTLTVLKHDNIASYLVSFMIISLTIHFSTFPVIWTICCICNCKQIIQFYLWCLSTVMAAKICARHSSQCDVVYVNVTCQVDYTDRRYHNGVYGLFDITTTVTLITVIIYTVCCSFLYK